jgi:hypothetical protein
MKKDRDTNIKYYVPFIIISSVGFLIIYNGIFSCYGVMDDYSQLYWARCSSLNDYMHWYVYGGRPFYGYTMYYLFSFAKTICNLKYIRLVSLVSVIAFSVLIFRVFVKVGWEKTIAGIGSMMICLLPAFNVYIAWASSFHVVFAGILAFIAGEMSLQSYKTIFNTKSTPNGGLKNTLTESPCEAKSAVFCEMMSVPKVKKRLFKKLTKSMFLMLVSQILLFFSLCLYQPSAPFYFFFLVINFTNSNYTKKGYLGTLVYTFFVFAVIGIAYYALFRAGVWPFGCPEIVRESYLDIDRGIVTTHILEKIIWFLKGGFFDSLTTVFFMQSQFVRVPVVIITFVIILVGLYKHIKRVHSSQFLNALVLIGMIPVAYFPSLLSTDDYVSMRTQGVLSVLVVLYILLALKNLLKYNLFNKISIFILVFFIGFGYYNFNSYLIKNNIYEYEALQAKITKVITEDHKEIAFVRANCWDTSRNNCTRAEFDQPATILNWVPSPLVQLIMEDKTGKCCNTINVLQYDTNNLNEIPDTLPVINANEILKYNARGDR